MSDQSEMFGHPMSSDFGNVTGSQASPSGRMHSGLLGGKTKESAGQDPHPASPSARQAKAKRSTTKGIFGQSGFHSSKHEDLSFALASRYQALTDSLGSTLFTLTWSTRITPSGFSIPAQRASEPRTEDSVCIGWPTPKVATGKYQANGDHAKPVLNLEGVAELSSWSTPQSSDMTGGGQAKRSDGRANLNDFAMLAGWKTPCVPNGGRISGNTADIGKHQDGTKAQIGLENEARLSGWTTPQAHDQTGRSKGQKEIQGTMHGCACLVSEARLSGWQTPKVATGDYQYSNGDHSNPFLNLSGEARLTAFGDQPIGYLLGPNGWEIVPACGQLNAGHSRWLMGLPAIWCEAGIAAFRSLKKRKRA